jgi:rod shape-determining protein MreD
MKQVLFPLFSGIFLLTLQATLLTSFPIQRVRPDIVLVLVLYMGFSHPPISGGLLAFFMGFLMDLFSGNGLGLFTFSRTFIFYGARIFRNWFYLEDFSSLFLFVVVSGIAEGIVILALVTVLSSTPYSSLYSLLFTSLLPQSFTTGLVSPFLFSLFDKTWSWIGMNGRERS